MDSVSDPGNQAADNAASSRRAEDDAMVGQWIYQGTSSAEYLAISVDGELKDFIDGGKAHGFSHNLIMKSGPKVQGHRLIIDCRHEDGRFEHFEVTYVVDHSGTYRRITPLTSTILS